MIDLTQIESDYRRLGPMDLETWNAELKRVNSPLQPDAEAMWNVAGPHSALMAAQIWMECQYETDRELLSSSDHNPLNLRPWEGDPTPPLGVVGTKHQFLQFDTPASCVKEWRNRIVDDPTYKGGVYNKARTVSEMIAIYAPAGDVHPVTGKDNADIDYANTVGTMLNRYAASELPIDLAGSAGSKIGSAIDKPFAPAALLPFLEQAEGETLIVRHGENVFFRIDVDVVAIRTTPRYARASIQSDLRGEDMMKGEKAHIEWGWIEPDGTFWMYSDYATRFKGSDFTPVGVSIVVPGQSTAPPPEQGTITADNYRQEENPETLLPPILWKGSTNLFPNRHGRGQAIAIVYHCTDDLNLQNTVSWFQNPNSEASSHFVIDRDGVVYQFVSSKDASWTNGDWKVGGVAGYRRDIEWLAKAIDAGHNVNDYTISYEFVATPATPPTQAQYDSAIKLSRYFCHPKVLSINPNRSHQNRHADINGISRGYCPGPDFDLDMIIAALGGDPTAITR